MGNGFSKEAIAEIVNAATEGNILIPTELLDALLANISNRNFQAVELIGNQIRELAEDQDTERFKTHRHGK